MRASIARKLYMGIIVIFLILVFIVMLFPFYWMTVSSFKPLERIFSDPIVLLPKPFSMQSYTKLFANTPYIRWYFNSIIITVFYTGLALLFSTLGGFGFAKYQFPLRNQLLLLVISSMMIPFHVVMIPLFILLVKIHWINTYWGVVIPFAASPFGIFFIRQYLSSVPSELMDAARIDGCSEFGIYHRIILPLIKPAIGTLTIYFAMFGWNWFIWPLVVIRVAKLVPLTVGIASFVNDYRLRYDEMMAASTLCTLPLIILFLSMQKQFISGMTAGSLKG